MQYRTPGVYVEEISLLPPSISEVETAIPAFIGYTQKADLLQPNDLSNVPQEVNSLAEYQLYFGFGPSIQYSTIELDASNGVSKSTSNQTYYLYDSIRLFFNNGGGKCFIISVGLYTAEIRKDDFIEKGLVALRSKDEPTLILFPDAVSLPADEFHAVQQAALRECGDPAVRVDFNRFVVMDLQQDASELSWKTGIDSFRNQVGINNLKYGAAYTPWLKATLSKNIGYRDLLDTSAPVFTSKLRRGGVMVNIIDLANSYTDSERGTIRDRLTALDQAIADSNKLRADFTANLIKAEEFNRLNDKFNTASDLAEKLGTLVLVFDYLYSLADLLQTYTTSAGLGSINLKTQAEQSITAVKSVYGTLISHDVGAADVAGFSGSAKFPRFSKAAHQPNVHANWEGIFGDGAGTGTHIPAASTAIFDAAAAGSDEAKKIAQMTAAWPTLRDTFNVVLLSLQSLRQAAENYELTLQTVLIEGFPALKSILNTLKSSSSIVPPSGAVAGIYAYVDGTRGVWKAPANVSLSSVSGVTIELDDKKQESLNDHPTGKSINAIRTFVGKGILVWGARTLDATSSEWRYVPVRRFYNLVEESARKACEHFVFEPNDANTWVKVRSMIENYLTTLWRQGALAGAKAEQAFYVRVGLKTTMTDVDINEGRMIVTIGMAPVRPAEFIILNFSQLMQQS
ncbi:hypothetical protein GCM10028803_21880 [Larkinella knui]|uniref:Phage tail protein n=1 Tax=Larkinella knui TaxID=2025310 RepID=A0A3P1CVD2_9BACT|nr:phage tail sheath C-terminal domain-containing protein [Larkinella knui]RRB17265.1 phage tail protein [Larkinella knui]